MAPLSEQVVTFQKLFWTILEQANPSDIVTKNPYQPVTMMAIAKPTLKGQTVPFLFVSLVNPIVSILTPKSLRMEFR